ncbi:hypothetical protein XPR_1306 [Xanthomonas arboricola pv. pruni MAFF 301420]|uniref:Uncharacterized protein n=2 Tax=Xanthomonas arboricola pv. pruni TaxID=69929 RepID=W4SDT1_9XANT|nr:hypothetical protein XPU_3669 [Xanthomonas arboricola pv. pruni str. MAFF 311562]GAE54671.1 hypothetical protein XPR_1306 [Xanthomonas arboricola pv. pruni MAFF 301420]
MKNFCADSELAHFWLFFTQIPASPQTRQAQAGQEAGRRGGHRAQLKLPGLPRTRKPARSAGADA